MTRPLVAVNGYYEKINKQEILPLPLFLQHDPCEHGHDLPGRSRAPATNAGT